jgi:hypothetical protein
MGEGQLPEVEHKPSGVPRRDEFSPDGRLLLAVSRSTTVLVWELPTG